VTDADDPREPPVEPSIERFLGAAPTQELADWRELWEADTAFPLRSHRGLLGRLVVAFKRLLRPLVRLPQSDLWERQRTFNLVLLNMLEARRDRLDRHRDQLKDLHAARKELLHDLRQVRDDLLRDIRNHERRIIDLEGVRKEGMEAIMRHVDALFAVVDQKFDRYREDNLQIWSRLGSLLAVAESARTDSEGDSEPISPPELAAAWRERQYLELEERFRGVEEEIARRVAIYLPYLERGGEVLDLGCGRGELLALLGERGVAARGVDASEEMVRRCREQGLAAERADLFEGLERAGEESLGGVISLHVIEHLPAATLPRLAALAWRALRPGGVLILETPNPMSLVVAARNFWLDPTHVRPVHPKMLAFCLEQAGFDPIERLDLRRFGDNQRLPELAPAELAAELRPLAEQINRLRDRIDDELFGFQDYGLVATKPAVAAASQTFGSVS
jgi:O-antigen chain-terminating methyltransferase